jgi:hypothetical protein
MSAIEKVEYCEPITQNTVSMIVRTLGPLTAIICGLNEVDLTKGAGVINKQSKCLWTKSRHRITIVISSDGGIIAHKSRDPDPDCPK